MSSEEQQKGIIRHFIQIYMYNYLTNVLKENKSDEDRMPDIEWYVERTYQRLKEVSK